MSQQINDNFNINAAKSLDLRYGKIVAGKTVPFVSTAEANTTLVSAYRFRGQTVLIDTGLGQVEYWYKDGILDGNLVQKIPATEPDIVADLTAAGIGSIGSVNDGDTFLSGESLETIVRRMLIKELNPTYTSPTIVLSSSVSGNIEKGSSISPVLTATATQNDAGTISDVKFLKDSSVINTDTVSPYTYTVPSFVLNAAATFRGDMYYGQGVLKNTNLGNAYPIGRIAAGSTQSNSITINPVYPYFYGTSTVSTIATIAAGVYAGGGAIESTKIVDALPNTINIADFGTDNRYIWFAVPTGSKTFTSWFGSEINFGLIGTSEDLFGAKQVQSITSSLGWTQNYDIYVSNYPTAFSGTMQIN